MDLNKISLPYSVPYYSQVATPELAFQIFSHEMSPLDDPNWKETGTQMQEEYAYWVERSCGIACVKMCVEALGGPRLSMMEWIRRGLAIGGYLEKVENGTRVELGWIHRALADLILNLEGIFVCDAGYLLKKEELEKFFEAEKRLYIATRNNMKRLMTKEQHELFKRRSVIENVWNTLKERMNMAYSFARGVHGLFRHYLYCICSYLLRNLFERLNYDLMGEIRLSIA